MHKEEQGKRYNLMLPENLRERVQHLADEDEVSFLEKLKYLIKLGMMVHGLLKSPGASLILRNEGGEEKEVILLPL